MNRLPPPRAFVHDRVLLRLSAALLLQAAFFTLFLVVFADLALGFLPEPWDTRALYVAVGVYAHQLSTRLERAGDEVAR